jgi:peptide deformylase
MSNNDDIILYDTEKRDVEPEQIETFDLVDAAHPALHMVLPEFDFANATINPVDFASSLVETCRKNNGLGLSANQCGFEHRVFVMGADNEYVAYFNPKVIKTYDEDGEVHMPEACLSFPALTLRITRASKIDVSYQDYNGETHTKTFNGMTARCFLHELDHMNGIVYTSRVKTLAFKFGMKKLEKQKNRFFRQMKAYTKSMNNKPRNTKPKIENAATRLMASFGTNGN